MPADFFFTVPAEDAFFAVPAGVVFFVASAEGDLFAVPEEDTFLAVPEEDAFLAVPADDAFLGVPAAEVFLAAPAAWFLDAELLTEVLFCAVLLLLRAEAAAFERTCLFLFPDLLILSDCLLSSTGCAT